MARAALVLLAVAAGPALGQSTLSGGRGTLLVPDADTVPPTHFTTSFGASYAATSRDRFQLAPAGVTFGFTNSLDVGLALQSWSPADVEARGAPVDPQLTLKLRALTESPRRPALALSLVADHAFDGWDLSPSLILHKNRGPLLLTGQLGYRLPLRGGPADPAGPFGAVAAGYWLSAATSLFLQAVGEGGPDRHLWIMPGVAWSLLGPDPYEKQRESLREKARQSVAALEAELGVKIDAATDQAALASAQAASAPVFGGRTPALGAPGRVTFFVTGGPALGAGPGWRVLAGIQISTFDEFLQDSDGDGIPDRVDQCPFEPEDWDGYQDEDGCPDHGAEVLRKRAEERLKAAQEDAAKLTTPVPRFRLRIPLGEVPAPGASRRETAPMYQPGAPPAPAAPPASPPPRPRPEDRSQEHQRGEQPPAKRSEPPEGAAAAPASPERIHAVALPRPAVTIALMILPPSVVVKNPAPMLRVPPGGAGAPGEPPLRVERDLAAVAFVQFASPDQPLSDADRESIERVVRLAVGEGSEVLVWARARDPELLPEAARRAESSLALASRQGALVVTRVTTSAASSSPVELEVSTMRDRLQLAYRGTAGPSARGAAPESPPLASGDAARRQIQAAVARYRAGLVRCLAPGARGARGRRMEAVVRVAVDPEGAAAVVLRHDSPLWRPAVDACLQAQARGWHLPRDEGGYLVDVPVTVVVKEPAR